VRLAKNGGREANAKMNDRPARQQYQAGVKINPLTDPAEEQSPVKQSEE
jgi:hypothetical protein